MCVCVHVSPGKTLVRLNSVVQSSVRKNRQAACAYFLSCNEGETEEKQPLDEYYANSDHGNCPSWRNNLLQVT